MPLSLDLAEEAWFTEVTIELSVALTQTPKTGIIADSDAGVRKDVSSLVPKHAVMSANRTRSAPLRWWRASARLGETPRGVEEDFLRFHANIEPFGEGPTERTPTKTTLHSAELSAITIARTVSALHSCAPIISLRKARNNPKYDQAIAGADSTTSRRVRRRL